MPISLPVRVRWVGGRLFFPLYESCLRFRCVNFDARMFFFAKIASKRDLKVRFSATEWIHNIVTHGTRDFASEKLSYRQFFSPPTRRERGGRSCCLLQFCTNLFLSVFFCAPTFFLLYQIVLCFITHLYLTYLSHASYISLHFKTLHKVHCSSNDKVCIQLLQFCTHRFPNETTAQRGPTPWPHHVPSIAHPVYLGAVFSFSGLVVNFQAPTLLALGRGSATTRLQLPSEPARPDFFFGSRRRTPFC